MRGGGLKLSSELLDVASLRFTCLQAAVSRVLHPLTRFCLCHLFPFPFFFSGLCHCHCHYRCSLSSVYSIRKVFFFFCATTTLNWIISACLPDGGRTNLQKNIFFPLSVTFVVKPFSLLFLFVVSPDSTIHNCTLSSIDFNQRNPGNIFYFLNIQISISILISVSISMFFFLS